MATRPKSSLDDLAIPKTEAPAPPQPAPALPALDMPATAMATQERAGQGGGAPSVRGYAHTLSLRLTAEQYRRLRRYTAKVEDETGQRATHQSIIEAALTAYLDVHE